jgi:hypothetical protein
MLRTQLVSPTTLYDPRDNIKAVEHDTQSMHLLIYAHAVVLSTLTNKRGASTYYYYARTGLEVWPLSGTWQ